MEEDSNPIATLHKVMKKAVDASTGRAAIDVWANIFGCKPEDAASVARGLLSVTDLLDRSYDAVRKFVPGDTTLFMAPLDQIKAMLSTLHLGGSWSQGKGYLTDDTMLSLEFCVYAMNQFYPNSSSDDYADIKEFLSRLDELVTSCIESDLNEELKMLFLRHLEAIRAALLIYRVEGASALEDAVDAAIGAVYRNAQKIKDVPEDKKSYVARFFDVLGKANDLVSGGQTAALLAAPVVMPILLPFIT